MRSKPIFVKSLAVGYSFFESSVERSNLTFEVIPVSSAEKLERSHELIASHLSESDLPGGVIVYAATRNATEEIQGFLQHQGMLAEVFHGGLESKQKREIIGRFVAGEVPRHLRHQRFRYGDRQGKHPARVATTTCRGRWKITFKRQAGRGETRNRRAAFFCMTPQDANLQFMMGAMSEVKRKEIARILRALRRKKKNAYGEIVVTSDELLRDEDWAEMQNLKPEFRDTKIRAAVAWLERAGFLERNHNQTDLFQGKPLVDSLEQAIPIIDRLDLSTATRDLWLIVLQQILNRQGDQGLRADELAEALYPEKERLLEIEQRSGLTAAQVVIQILHDMATAGLIDQGVMLSATFRPKGKNNALKTLETASEIENKLISLLMALDPDAEQGLPVEMDIRRLNQKMKNEGLETSPDHLRQLIKGISYDGKGLAASQGSFEIVHIDRNRYQVSLKRSWKTIRDTIFLRQNVAHRILSTLIDRAKKQAAETGSELTGDVQVSFTSDELAAAIKSDLVLSVQVKKPLPAIDRGAHVFARAGSY